MYFCPVHNLLLYGNNRYKASQINCLSASPAYKHPPQAATKSIKKIIEKSKVY